MVLPVVHVLYSQFLRTYSWRIVEHLEKGSGENHKD